MMIVCARKRVFEAVASSHVQNPDASAFDIGGPKIDTCLTFIVTRKSILKTITESKSSMPMIEQDLKETALDRHAAEGILYRLEAEGIRCVACGHRCLLRPGQRGVCKVRFNVEGRLRVPFGYVSSLACDPVEKKPFFHLCPGANAMTFGMLGCNFHCDFCQNWFTSQTLRDDSAGAPMRVILPEQITFAAKRQNARLLVSSYNEPLITPEWAAAIFRAAKKQNLRCAIVSNGHATPEALDFWSPLIDAIKVDLKCFDRKTYLNLGGKMQAVTETIEQIHQRGIWLEVVTLIIPGLNDSESELTDLAGFLASVSQDIPWHVTAFHAAYRASDSAGAISDHLLRAAHIGSAAGLRFVYAGNLPGGVGNWENTRCPSCLTTLIERTGFQVHSCHLTDGGLCPHCGYQVPGIWS
jgi:pyruvate formate lyase activating enzyme